MVEEREEVMEPDDLLPPPPTEKCRHSMVFIHVDPSVCGICGIEMKKVRPNTWVPIPKAPKKKEKP